MEYDCLLHGWSCVSNPLLLKDHLHDAPWSCSELVHALWLKVLAMLCAWITARHSYAAV